jgi:hypothetical protein
MTMRRRTWRLPLAVCGALLIGLASCGGPDDNTGGPGPGPTTSVVTKGSPAPGGSAVSARATVDADGLLFVGADTAKVGDTLTVLVTNDAAGAVEVALVDPAGHTAVHNQIAAHSGGEIAARIDRPGTWTVTFDGESIGGQQTKAITVG